jgi:DeoR/GlpR family transcriptional regulator of sugar metabolism
MVAPAEKPQYLRSWVVRSGKTVPEWKRALAHHVVGHRFIKYGSSLLLGSGTTPIFLIQEIIRAQTVKLEPWDLAIFTSNLQVFWELRDARQKYAEIFGDTQVILTGGKINNALDSLIGDYAARAVRSSHINPSLVFFGAAALSFRQRLQVSFQFEEEIATQVAFATRPTEQRFLLVDHTKIGKSCFYDAELSIEALLDRTRQAYIITTIDPADPTAMANLQKEEEALERLLTPLVNDPKFADKDFIFRVVKEDGSVHKELSLEGLRQSRCGSVAR